MEIMVALIKATTDSLRICFQVLFASNELLAKPCTTNEDDWVPTLPPVPPINGL